MRKYWFLILAIFLASLIRFYKLDAVPVSMFGDEMDVGYQAYSILKTGNDYYGNSMPLHFHSLAEWRTPLYLYSTVPTVAIFGISPLGVRLPAAFFGVLGVVSFYFLVKIIRENYLKIESSNLENIASFMLAISPWHIQYSRAAFEVTELLFLLIAGLYFFLVGFNKSKYLLLSTIFLALAPWVYSTAKLFVPALVIALVLLFWKRLRKLKPLSLSVSLVLYVLISLPLIFSILFGGGAQRFNYINVFSDPTIEHEIGVAREVDKWGNSIFSRAFHNKFEVWSEAIVNNFLKSYSTNFLFVDGDLNLRHSIEDMGMFYKIELVALIVGLVYFFSAKFDKKIKIFLLFWLIAGVIPAAITRDGGSHATRLILVLPPFLFLISYGVWALSKKRILLLSYLLALSVLFVQYQHQFWVHNPSYSERWWHYGWQGAIDVIKSVEDKYDKIVISTADEPPWIFFAAAYKYPPERWQQSFPLDNKVMLNGFGEISYIDKFYFGKPVGLELYDWGKVLDDKTLYLASTKEVRVNLIREPERTPGDLTLVKAIAFPSGEPAFYLFSGRGSDEN